MLTKYKILNGKVVEAGPENGCNIYFFYNPNEEEKKNLLVDFQIDEYDVNSALDPDELGRAEFNPDYTVFIVKKPKRYSFADNFLLKISSVGMFLFQDKLIILMSDDDLKFSSRPFLHVNTLSELVVKVIYDCIMHFEGHLKVIHSISDELEGEINKSMENKKLLNMFSVTKSLVYYLRAIGSNAKVLERIKVSSAKINLTVENIEFLDDVMIENTQCYEQASIISQVLSSMMDAWASVVNNNLNVFMKRLTIAMICLMAPTLIMNIFSMNVLFPFSQTNSVIPFWIIMALSFGSVGFVIMIARKKNW